MSESISEEFSFFQSPEIIHVNEVPAPNTNNTKRCNNECMKSGFKTLFDDTFEEPSSLECTEIMSYIKMHDATKFNRTKSMDAPLKRLEKRIKTSSDEPTESFSNMISAGTSITQEIGDQRTRSASIKCLGILSKPIIFEARNYSQNSFRNIKHDKDDASIECAKMCRRFNYHYVVYVYCASINVDADTLPFRKHQYINAHLNYNTDANVKEEIIHLKKVDKRLQCIEQRADCRIHLGKLNDFRSFIKGLPRRRLTIASDSFQNISLALKMLESKFPRLMSTAVYPYRLPSLSSTQYHTGSAVTSNKTWNRGRKPNNIGIMNLPSPKVD